MTEDPLDVRAWVVVFVCGIVFWCAVTLLVMWLV